MATYWQTLESQVLGLLNALEATDVASAEAIYTKQTAKSDADIGDQAMFLARVRDAIVDAHQQVIRFICQAEGHPRRALFRSVVEVAHRAPLPVKMAYGAVFVGDEGEEIELDERAPSEIEAIRRDLASLGGVAVYYYAKSGNTLLATVSPVNVEVFDYDRPARHPSELVALFSENDDLIVAPDEFVGAIVHFATAQLALTAGSLQEQSTQHFQMAVNALRGAGVRVETGDFTDLRMAQKGAEANQ